MKVCIVVAPVEYGGGENLLFNLSKSLKTKGIEIEFLNLTKSRRFEEKLKSESLKYKTLTDININFTPTKREYLILLFKLFPKLLFYTRMFKRFDVIHCNGFPSSFLLGFLSMFHVVRNKTTKLIYTHHSEKERTFGLNRYIYYLVLNQYTKITSVSQKTSQSLVNSFPELVEKIITINNGIDLEKYGRSYSKLNLRNKHNISNEDIVAVYVARFSPLKNHKFLLKLLKKVENKNFKIMMIGEGDELNEIKSHANILGLSDRVIFTGFIDNEEIHEYLALSDLCVFPSLKEGFGISIIEAMASRLPVVIFENIYIEDFGKNVFVSTSEDEFVEYTRKLISDDSLRLFLSEKVHMDSLRFDINQIANHYIEMYEAKL